MVWILPVVYWFGDRDRGGRVHEWVQALSFLCMGWLSFLLVLTVGRDMLLLATAVLPPLAAVHTLLDESGATWVPVAALAAVGVGALAALRGPYVRRVNIPVEGLAPDLDGFRIVQISDLHAGPTMRPAYVQRVVARTKALAPGLIARTDGDARPAFRLLLAHNPKIAPLAEQAGFDLQLSGHTHAGQFFPWTFVIHWVHGPHAAGLSRRGRLWVYVSAGTGTWGPPVRLGTRPELTLLRLVAANGPRRR